MVVSINVYKSRHIIISDIIMMSSFEKMVVIVFPK